jgi:hypothetical protein
MRRIEIGVLNRSNGWASNAFVIIGVESLTT